MVWTVILAILAIPIGLPLAIAVTATVFALLLTLFTLLLSFAALALALLVFTVLSWVTGFILLFSHFATGLFYLGVGFLAAGLCLLCALGLWYLSKLCVRGIAQLFNAIRKKLTRRARSTQ